MIAATTAEAVGFGGRPPERRMRLVSWRPMTKGTLRGFATVELPIGLKVHDVLVFVGRNGVWASLPSKPQVDRDGRQKTDANGKTVYVPVLEWRSRDLSDRFSEAVIALVHAAHPADLNGDSP